jgi:hypothetical protein
LFLTENASSCVMSMSALQAPKVARGARLCEEVTMCRKLAPLWRRSLGTYNK